MVSLRDTEVEAIVLGHVDSMDIISHFTKVLLDGRKYQLIFRELVGMNIATYNRTDHPHPQQDRLNEAINLVNIEIVSRNRALSLATPWVAKQVHKNLKNGKKSNRYQKLGEDGLHLTDAMRSKWAYEIIQAIKKNKDRFDGK